jgi:hypothetical protein
MADSELDRLDPEPTVLKFKTGFQVEVMRLRTRQFFRLLKILTHGAGPALLRLQLDPDNPEAFGQQMLMLIIVAIPDAEQDAIQFLASMARPVGLKGEGKPDSQLTKQEKEDNAKLWEKFNEELNNPDPWDTLDLVQAIIEQESDDIQALGKRLASMMRLASRTGASEEKLDEAPPPQELNASPEPSPQPSTSSATSTDGETSTSSDSPSAGSASASKRPRAASKPSG